MPPLRERLPSLGPRTLAVAAIASVLFVHWLGVPLLDRTELITYDLRFHWRGERAPAPEVVLAVVDEKSLDALGRWPWSRTRMAELVDALSRYGARVIAFDIGFLEPESAQADGALASAIARSPADVVLGYFFHDPNAAGAVATDPDALERALEPISFTALTVQYRGSSPDVLPFLPGDAPEANLPEITAAAEGAGYFNIRPDPDNVVRRTPLVMGAGLDAYPSLALAAAWFGLGRPPLIVDVAQSGNENLVTGIRLGDQTLVTDARGEALLSYPGPGGTIPHVPVSDILAGAAPEDALRDRIVIVGVTAIGVFDLRATPFAPVYPGAEVQATALDNILRNRFITRPGWASLADQIAIVLLGAVTALAVSRLGAVSELVAALAIAAAYAGVAVRLFASGIWIDLVHPLLAVGVTYLSLAVRAFFVEQVERARITGMFGQYVSPIVVEQMRAHPEQLRLGGEERVLTVLFCDMAGFTTIAERLTPTQTIELLSEFHARMTEQIYSCEGMLKEYVGDEVMAIFGAPVEQPDHAVRACRAALAMRDARTQLSAEWAQRGYPPIRSRTGVNTGAMLVGNIGSKYRFSYGVVGDAVNLGSRIEGLNKLYGTEILIGEQTEAMLGDAFRLREVDAVRVVGKKLPVRMFELLGEVGETLDPRREKLLEHYAAGLAAYRERRFDTGLMEFDAALTLVPEDGPSRTLAERCRVFQAAPPAPDWDGAYSATEK
jgi:adenylate cyclase